MNRRTSFSLILILAAIGSTAIFQWLQQPFLWTMLLWTVITVAGVVWLRGTSLQVVLINLATALLVLTVFEGYLLLREMKADQTRMQGEYTIDYFDADNLLGYGPAKDKVATSEKYHGNDLIYSVQYTIDEHGLRISPVKTEPELGCVLFFGGSVTFGEGVADDQAMPYQVGALTGHHYRIYNFAFHGYGPHQMLAVLESGRVDEITDCRPTHVLYQAIIPHVERAVGRAVWDKQGPRYTLKQEGGVKLAGRFNDAEFDPVWKGLLGQWLTFDTLFGRRRTPGEEEIQLYTEIVNTAREYTEQHYPGSEFHLLIWDNDKITSHDQVMEALRARKFRIHRISDILPDYRVDKARYELDLYDHHPAAATHTYIARYVAQQILGYR